MHHRVGNLIQEVNAGVILHQVNCQGVMGSGFAKELRSTYPVVWNRYFKKCADHFARNKDQGLGLLGQAQLVQVTDKLWVCNLFAQQFYGRDNLRYTSYDAVDEGLQSLARMLQDLPPLDIHHPLLGCGLGGAVWSVIETIITFRLGEKTTLWMLPAE
jgi:O-acetyl-ADP-ribose deacetylase (regulator of RNase III)